MSATTDILLSADFYRTKNSLLKMLYKFLHVAFCELLLVAGRQAITRPLPNPS
jgi:hypothetical protein